MLVAEKENLQSAFRLRMLSIRDKELDFFMQNMQNVAKLAALLAGVHFLNNADRLPMADHLLGLVHQ